MSIFKNTSYDHFPDNYKNSDDIIRLAAKEQATNYRKQGFNRSETVELLMADRIAQSVATEVTEIAFEDEDPDLSEDTELVKAYQIPVNYESIRPSIEEALDSLGASEFVAKLTEAEDPIVKADKQTKDDLLTLAEQVEDGKGNVPLIQLHAVLRPWVEEALYTSVIMAEDEPGKVVSVNDDEEASHKIILDDDREVLVDYYTGETNSERNSNSNLDVFGIPDENLVRVFLSEEPVMKLARAL